jgi:SAM-dependent methyltransferase
MKPTTTEEIFEILDGCTASAALGAGMELGIFWLLDAQTLSVEDIAERLGIPLNRCRYFLDLLLRMGLIEEAQGGFTASPTARHAILEVYRQDTWALLAQEVRERSPALRDLALHLREPGSIFDALEFSLPDYVTQMNDNPERARRFTNMLYELHQDLANTLVDIVDIGSSRRMLDLGGGSGVVSFSFLRKHPELTSVVVDVATVCAAGQEIAREIGMEDRIAYLALDFQNDPLPEGFDFILECDVNVYTEELFRKILASLNPGGRFVIVDQLPLKEGTAPDARLEWAFFGSLKDPNFTYPTAGQVKSMLERAGFQDIKLRDPSAFIDVEFMNDMVILEAFKGKGQNT